MWNDASNNKKIVCFIVFFLLILIAFSPQIKSVAYAENDELFEELEQTTDGILSDIDTSKIDEYLTDESFINYFSFKDFIGDILSGEYLVDYG